MQKTINDSVNEKPSLSWMSWQPKEVRWRYIWPLFHYSSSTRTERIMEEQVLFMAYLIEWENSMLSGWLQEIDQYLSITRKTYPNPVKLLIFILCLLRTCVMGYIVVTPCVRKSIFCFSECNKIFVKNNFLQILNYFIFKLLHY